MSNSFINLTESTFPFVINKKLANLNGLNDLGELTTNIKVKFKIDIISKCLFLVNGNIDVQHYFSTDCSAVTSVEESTTRKEILRTVDVLGRVSEIKKNTTLFYIYKDGTVEKSIIIE